MFSMRRAVAASLKLASVAKNGGRDTSDESSEEEQELSSDASTTGGRVLAPSKGDRVKVKFDGHNWYWGSVSSVEAIDGSRWKIAIDYEDGTTEAAAVFPDNDIKVYTEGYQSSEDGAPRKRALSSGSGSGMDDVAKIRKRPRKEHGERSSLQGQNSSNSGFNGSGGKAAKRRRHVPSADSDSEEEELEDSKMGITGRAASPSLPQQQRQRKLSHDGAPPRAASPALSKGKLEVVASASLPAAGKALLSGGHGLKPASAGSTAHGAAASRPGKPMALNLVAEGKGGLLVADQPSPRSKHVHDSSMGFASAVGSPRGIRVISSATAATARAPPPPPPPPPPPSERKVDGTSSSSTSSGSGGRAVAGGGEGLRKRSGSSSGSGSGSGREHVPEAMDVEPAGGKAAGAPATETTAGSTKGRLPQQPPPHLPPHRPVDSLAEQARPPKPQQTPSGSGSERSAATSGKSGNSSSSGARSTGSGSDAGGSSAGGSHRGGGDRAADPGGKSPRAEGFAGGGKLSPGERRPPGRPAKVDVSAGAAEAVAVPSRAGSDAVAGAAKADARAGAKADTKSSGVKGGRAAETTKEKGAGATKASSSSSSSAVGARAEPGPGGDARPAAEAGAKAKDALAAVAADSLERGKADVDATSRSPNSEARDGTIPAPARKLPPSQMLVPSLSKAAAAPAAATPLADVVPPKSSLRVVSSPTMPSPPPPSRRVADTANASKAAASDSSVNAVATTEAAAVPLAVTRQPALALAASLPAAAGSDNLPTKAPVPAVGSAPPRGASAAAAAAEAVPGVGKLAGGKRESRGETLAAASLPALPKKAATATEGPSKPSKGAVEGESENRAAGKAGEVVVSRGNSNSDSVGGKESLAAVHAATGAMNGINLNGAAPKPARQGAAAVAAKPVLPESVSLAPAATPAAATAAAVPAAARAPAVPPAASAAPPAAAPMAAADAAAPVQAIVAAVVEGASAPALKAKALPPSPPPAPAALPARPPSPGAFPQATTTRGAVHAPAPPQAVAAAAPPSKAAALPSAGAASLPAPGSLPSPPASYSSGAAAVPSPPLPPPAAVAPPAAAVMPAAAVAEPPVATAAPAAAAAAVAVAAPASTKGCESGREIGTSAVITAAAASAVPLGNSAAAASEGMGPAPTIASAVSGSKPPAAAGPPGPAAAASQEASRVPGATAAAAAISTEVSGPSSSAFAPEGGTSSGLEAGASVGGGGAPSGTGAENGGLSGPALAGIARQEQHALRFTALAPRSGQRPEEGLPIAAAAAEPMEMETGNEVAIRSWSTRTADSRSGGGGGGAGGGGGGSGSGGGGGVDGVSGLPPLDPPVPMDVEGGATTEAKLAVDASWRRGGASYAEPGPGSPHGGWERRGRKREREGGAASDEDVGNDNGANESGSESGGGGGGGVEPTGRQRKTVTRFEPSMEPDRVGGPRESRGRGRGRPPGKVGRIASGEARVDGAASQLQGAGDGSAAAATAWVQCDDCKQWRKLPQEVNVDDLPKTWRCKDNRWDKVYNACSVPEEDEDESSPSLPSVAICAGIVRPGSGLAGGRTGKRGRPRNQPLLPPASPADPLAISATIGGADAAANTQAAAFAIRSFSQGADAAGGDAGRGASSSGGGASAGIDAIAAAAELVAAGATLSVPPTAVPAASLTSYQVGGSVNGPSPLWYGPQRGPGAGIGARTPGETAGAAAAAAMLAAPAGAAAPGVAIGPGGAPATSSGSSTEQRAEHDDGVAAAAAAMVALAPAALSSVALGKSQNPAGVAVALKEELEAAAAMGAAAGGENSAVSAKREQAEGSLPGGGGRGPMLGSVELELRPRDGSDAAAAAAGGSEDDAPATGASTAAKEVEDWVECTKCEKWRRVPPNVDSKSFVENWTCAMITWDLAVASCDAPDEAESSSHGGATSRGGGGGRGGGGYKGKGRRPGTLSAATAPAGVASAAGPVPAGLLSGMVPAAAAAATAASSGLAMAMPGPRAGRSVSNSGVNGGLAAAAGSGGGGGGNVGRPKKTASQTQWVQCDKRSCQKWRKLPPGVAPESLPDKWYCAMNDWEPRLATCNAAQEDDYTETEGGGGGSSSRRSAEAAGGGGGSAGGGAGAGAGAAGGKTARGVHIMAGAGAAHKANGKLSYREMIFSNDGRLKAPFAGGGSGGGGAAGSLFAVQLPDTSDSEDSPAPPGGLRYTEGYATSSMYRPVHGRRNGAPHGNLLAAAQLLMRQLPARLKPAAAMAAGLSRTVAAAIGSSGGGQRPSARDVVLTAVDRACRPQPGAGVPAAPAWTPAALLGDILALPECDAATDATRTALSVQDVEQHLAVLAAEGLLAVGADGRFRPTEAAVARTSGNGSGGAGSGGGVGGSGGSRRGLADTTAEPGLPPPPPQPRALPAKLRKPWKPAVAAGNGHI